MGRTYSQLSLEERIELYHLLESGHNRSEIARRLGRHRSTIGREIDRNGQTRAKRKGVYAPVEADRRAHGRRRRDRRYKLARQPALRAYVKDRLAMGWSPAQIAGRLARQQGGPVISHESIYRYVYHRSGDNHKDYWHRLLPHRKHRRGKIVRGQPTPLAHLKNRVSVHDRPLAATARSAPGHWEADMMLFARYGQNVLVGCERMTRRIFLERLEDRTARRVAQAIKARLLRLPEAARQSVTFDNGTEFAGHEQLNACGLATYFCDIRAPWQKGAVENAIGRLRRWLPRKANLKDISTADLKDIERRANHTPRRCLGYKTPQEAYNEIIKNVALQT
jgi:IS30 family transposase